MRFVKTTTWLAYEDQDVTSNPSQQAYNWSDQFNIEIENADDRGFKIQPFGGQFAVFDTAIDGLSPTGTQYDWEMVTYKANTYRLTWVGGVTPPGFRTDRELTPTGLSFTFTVNTNASLTLSGPTTTLADVEYGDTVFIPGPITGDSATPVNALNQGFWVCIGANGDDEVQLVRPEGESFVGITETVAITDNSQIQAFSDGPVLAGQYLCLNIDDPANIYGKFFLITAVTANWIEVFSSESLTNEVLDIEPAAGEFIITTELRQSVRIVSDQPVQILVNANTQSVPLVPFGGQSAEMVITAPLYGLTVVNNGSSTARIRIFEVQ